MKFHALCASYLFSPWSLKNLVFSLPNSSGMILSQMSHTIYMSNLTLKFTQNMGLNFISTIVNNEAAVAVKGIGATACTAASKNYGTWAAASEPARKEKFV